MSAPTPALIHLDGLDLFVILAYFAATLAMGAVLGRKARAAEEFLLAGRRLTLPLFVGSLVATWYGGLLGVGEISYKDGLVNWLTQGGFWYLTYLLFALALARRLNQSGHTTLPDQMGALHGPTARLMATLLNFLNVVPVAYLLSLGLMIRLVTGWPLWLAVVLGAVTAALYSLLGGFKAVVYTDMLQFGLMCLAVALIIFYAVGTLGGGAYLEQSVPPTHLQVAGTYSAQELAVWALIALSTLVDPNFYHRCYAAGSPAVARNGILLAVGFWMLFDVCTTFGGLYARAALPGVDPRMAYPMLADTLLPSGAKGIFVTGVLATIMSTVDSYCLVGAMSLSHDLIRRTLGGGEDKVVLHTRLGVVVTGGLAMLFALVFPESIKSIWKTMGSLSTAAVLLPMVLGLLGWRPPGAGSAAMAAGMIGTLGWAAARGAGAWWAMGLEAMVPGLALALLAYCAAGLRAHLAGGEA